MSKLRLKVAELVAATPDITIGEITAACNAKTITQTYSRRINFRDMMRELDLAVALSVIGKLKAAAIAEPNGALAILLPALSDTDDGSGIDMSETNAVVFLDALETSETLSASEVASIKGMNKRLVSWATANGVKTVRDGHVERVR